MHLGSLESSQKLELLSAVLQATLTHFSSSPNILHASITRYMHAKHEQIFKYIVRFSETESGNTSSSLVAHSVFSRNLNQIE